MPSRTVSQGRFERVDYFGGRTHGYKLDGVKIPSVTGMLRGIPKDLTSWAAWEAARYAVNNHQALFHGDDANPATVMAEIAGAPTRARNAAGFSGTQVHRAAELLVRGERVDGIPDAYGDKVDAYVRFLDRWRVEPLLVEGSVCNLTVPYGGTLDVVFRSPLFPGRVFLGDVKTSRGVYPENALQLAAYGRADFYLDADGNEIPMAELGVTDHVVIHLTDDGYTVQQTFRGDAAWDLFLHGVAIARALEGRRGETDMDMLMLGPLYAPGEAW